jgi:hypothetical protein
MISENRSMLSAFDSQVLSHERFVAVKIGGAFGFRSLGEEREAIEIGLRLEYQDQLPEGLLEKRGPAGEEQRHRA